jgi:hypothetical protein
MIPTPNKDTNINFRVTEQKKLQLQKEAQKKKMTLSDLLNKIIDKNFEPPKSVKDFQKTNGYNKTSEEHNPIRPLGCLMLAILVGIVILLIKVLTKKKEPYYFQMPKNRSDAPK